MSHETPITDAIQDLGEAMALNGYTGGFGITLTRDQFLRLSSELTSQPGYMVEKTKAPLGFFRILTIETAVGTVTVRY